MLAAGTETTKTVSTLSLPMNNVAEADGLLRALFQIFPVNQPTQALICMAQL
jgi:hypothetical protein